MKTEEFYLKITQTEDGTYISRVTREEILKELNDGEFVKPILEDLPKFHDGYFAKQGTIFLKASVVVPRAVTAVTSYVL